MKILFFRFSSQAVHKTFHNLLLILNMFDMVRKSGLFVPDFETILGKHIIIMFDMVRKSVILSPILRPFWDRHINQNNPFWAHGFLYKFRSEDLCLCKIKRIQLDSLDLNPAWPMAIGNASMDQVDANLSQTCKINVFLNFLLFWLKCN